MSAFKHSCAATACALMILLALCSGSIMAVDVVNGLTVDFMLERGYLPDAPQTGKGVSQSMHLTLAATGGTQYSANFQMPTPVNYLTDPYVVTFNSSTKILSITINGGECYAASTISSTGVFVAGSFPNQYGQWPGCSLGTGWLAAYNITVGPLPLADLFAVDSPSGGPCVGCPPYADENKNPKTETNDPVRYGNGALIMWEDDLESTSVDGLRFRRSYSNLIGHTDGEMGRSWATNTAPRIISKDGAYAVRLNADKQVGFGSLGGNLYAAIRSGRETLIVTASGELVFADPMGMTMVFHGFGSGIPVRQQGCLKRLYTRAGQPQMITYDATGFAQQVRRVTMASDTEERLTFTYDPLTGLMTGAQRQRVVNGGTPEVVRSVTYGYDTMANQLRSVIVKDGTGAVLRQFHYRYYLSTETGSYDGLLKLAVGPRNYQRLVAANIDPESASTLDSQILSYADKVFSYDNQRRVTGQVLRTADVDGSGTFSYAYQARTSPPVPPGSNDWMIRFTETLPDSSVNTVFTNQAGDVLFKQTADPSGTVVKADAYRYNANWKVTWHITGAALQPVSGAWFDAAQSDLLGFAGGNSPYVKDSAGMINRYVYFVAGDATNGYLQHEQVQQGELGTPVLVRSFTYTVHQAP